MKSARKAAPAVSPAKALQMLSPIYAQSSDYVAKPVGAGSVGCDNAVSIISDSSGLDACGDSDEPCRMRTSSDRGFSIGGMRLAGALTAAGRTFVHGGKLLSRIPSSGKFMRALPAVSAFVWERRLATGRCDRPASTSRIYGGPMVKQRPRRPLSAF